MACRVLGQHRSTQRKMPTGRADEEALTADIIRLASEYGRYGYRRIAALLKSEGWTVNVKRVERIWRRPKLPTRNTHGTGCTLSAAITAGLAQGRSMEESIEHALAYVESAIRTAPGLGEGVGPVNHFAEFRL